MLESASANKMRCSACRPNSRNASSLMGIGDQSNLIICDNVALNKVADEVLQSRFMPSLFRPNPLDSYGYRSESFDHFSGIEEEYLQDELELLTTGGRGRGMGRGGGPGRRVPKLGVGGFFVKIPRHRALTTDEEPPDDDGNKKQKRPRKPRRSQLEDAYPPAIQEGFFGMRPVEGKTLVDTVVEEPLLADWGRGRVAINEGGHELSHEATEQLKNDLTEVDILDNLNMDIGDMDLDNMDFTNWIDDEDDEEFDDSLNDAFDIAKADGFDPIRAADPAPSSSMSHGPTGFGTESQSFPSTTPTPYMMPGSVQSLSRSSSQMDGSEKNNPTMERWEEDEPLGSQSTKAAVLYANEKHGYLKLSSQGSSVDSPTIQSPAPQQFYRPVVDQYDLMRTRTVDLQKHQEVIESDLNRMRKQKKNLAAKKRQMQKTAGVDADGKPIQELEACKRDLKTHTSTVYEFEQKWNIVRNAESSDAVRLAMAHRAAAGGGVAQHPTGFHPQMNQFQQMRVPQQVPYGAMIQPPDIQRQPMQTISYDVDLFVILKVPRARVWNRTPVLGGIVYERLQTPFEKEVYECVDDIVGMVSMQLDGRDPARDGHSGMLKRLLEPAMGSQISTMGQNGTNHLMDQLEPPRPKKKRTQQKKTMGMGNEYDLMVERVNTQLRLCEQLPKRALEPAPRNPGAAFATMGISDLPDRSVQVNRWIRTDKRALEGDELGEMSLTFVDDFYTGKERGPKLPAPPPYELIVDAEDMTHGSFDLLSAFPRTVEKQPSLEHIRVASKIPEFIIPLEPHRKVFSQKDDTVCFCSMKCYYQFVAASKVALSPDQLTAAESHVDEETLAKLRQISAESFAKCINQGKVTKKRFKWFNANKIVNIINENPSGCARCEPRFRTLIKHKQRALTGAPSTSRSAPIPEGRTRGRAVASFTDELAAAQMKAMLQASGLGNEWVALTYDYQFELEDTSDKIPCLCGAPNCVKWMN
uniref:Post-SET domain-containing protein n=1 Tax=Heterorhabditis bacteriophora TaxID=37862 RepID=A0A1I7X771_HETBA